MAKVGAANGVRAAALDPWLNLKHRSEAVPEWGGEELLLRALSIADWRDYNVLADSVMPADDESGAASPSADAASSHLALYAFALVRSLHTKARQRVFSDEDVAELARNFGPVHDRLAHQVFELSRIDPTGQTDPVTDAGNA